MKFAWYFSVLFSLTGVYGLGLATADESSPPNTTSTTANTIPNTSKYRIDFKIDSPHIQQLDNQHALVTGKILLNSNLQPSGLSYTIEIVVEGGPAQGNRITFPASAGLGVSRFADNNQPQIAEDGGLTALVIRLLGTSGIASDAEGKGRIFYRDTSTAALVSLKVQGGAYILTHVRYTLTGIDMALGGDCGQNGIAEPNNYRCGGSFIDRITILSSGAHNAYSPVDLTQTGIVADTITAHFSDANNSGRPDKPENRIVPPDSNRGNVSVFHPTDVGNTLQFRFSDAGDGLEGDPDGLHDFDAPDQAIGLASGVTFDLIEPPLPTAAVDSASVSIQGQVFADSNSNGLRDVGESGLANAVIALYEEQGLTEAVAKTLTSTSGVYYLTNLQANKAYRLEAQLPLPAIIGTSSRHLTPIRLIRHLITHEKANNSVDFAAWPFPLAIDNPQQKLLLPDLQPLTAYPVPTEQGEETRKEIALTYPGMQQWYLDTQTRPGRVLLRFGTLALNLGNGPLHVLGGKLQTDGQIPVYQRLYTQTGSFSDHLVGTFEQHTGHKHVHIAAFERYNLLDHQTEAVLASANKVSFCLTDVLWPIRPALTQAAMIGTIPMGWSCGGYEQSINVGFSDYYGPAIPDQLIDVTDIPDGTYWLEVIVNPEHTLQESDYTNNQVRLEIILDNPLK